MSQSFQQFLFWKKSFSSQQNKKLQTLFDLNVVKDAMQANEKEEIEAREKLISDLIFARNRMNDSVDDCGLADAIAKYEKAVENEKFLYGKVCEARVKHASLNFSMQMSVGEIEKKLLNSSDPRLTEFINILSEKFNEIRMKVSLSVYITRNWLTKDPIQHVVGNQEDIQAALDCINECIQVSKELQMQAFSAKHYESLIGEMCKTLAGVLSPFQILAPSIEDGVLKSN